MPNAQLRIVRIGVTGGIGSGKSAVCALFGELGVPVYSADEAARRLMQDDPEIRRRLTGLLGPDSYSPDGTLNRAYVASRIFSDNRLQKRVNDIVHPRVESDLDRWFGEQQDRGASLGIVEAALIYEAGIDKRLDYVIVVDADEAVRIGRVAARDGVPKREVRKRIAAQLPVSAKVRKADFVLKNNGTPEDLRANVLFLHRLLTQLVP